MESKITIRKSDEICNCSSCGARNYDSAFAAYSERTLKVSALFEVHIGTQCAILCGDCLDELDMHIAVVRVAEMCHR